MPFRMVGRTGPGMRQVGIGPREGVTLGANLGCAIVTNGDFAERHGPVLKLLWADLFAIIIPRVQSCWYSNACAGSGSEFGAGALQWRS